MDWPLDQNPESTIAGAELQNRIITSLKSINSIIGLQRASEDSILTGNLGLAIYHYSIPEIISSKDNQLLCTKIPEEVLDRVRGSDSSLKSYHYSNGLSGLGYCMQYLSDQHIATPDLDEELSAIDAFIYEDALSQTGNGSVEYLHGGSGALLYFNMRRSALSHHYREALVHAIFDQTSKDPLGIRIPTKHFVWAGTEAYDLSLSHGLCGVMHILLSVLEMGKIHDSQRIEAYLTKAAAYIAGLKRAPDKETGRFGFLPPYLEAASTPEQTNNTPHWPNSRLAWCNGDLGWVLFFYRFGKFTGNKNLIALADEIGISTTLRKTPEETNSSSAHFCHGHSGIAYFYKTLFQISGHPAYKSASEFWLNKTLQELPTELANDFYKKDSKETSLLQGLAGISLVLGAFLTNQDLKWQGLFLL
jgi:hypothetical protein